jgi:hypothetical protein
MASNNVFSFSHTYIHTYIVKVFGQAFGEPLVVGNVRTSLKPFRKLKPRLMQFGYKLLGEDVYVSALDRVMTQLPQPALLDLSALPVPAPVHVSQLLEGAGNTGDLRAQIESSVDRLLGVMEAQGTTSLLVVSDGSATFYGKTCIDASGGLVVVPVMDKSQVTTYINLGGESNSVGGVGVDGADVDADAGAEADAEEIVRTRESNPNSFQVVNKPSHSNEILVREEGSGLNPALYMRIEGMGGIVGTPFDAELIAGLAAVTLARIIVDRYEMRGKDGKGGKKLDIRVLTDSRALRTLLRSTKEVQAVQEVEKLVQVEVDAGAEAVGAVEAGAEAVEAGAVAGGVEVEAEVVAEASNRAALRLLCAAQCDYINVNAVGPTGHEVKIEWTAGHPERRDGSDTKM